MSADEPFAVESEVVGENGQWAVYLEFLTPHGPLRRFIAAYPSEASARMASRWLVWAARRDVRPPDGLFRLGPTNEPLDPNDERGGERDGERDDEHDRERSDED